MRSFRLKSLMPAALAAALIWTVSGEPAISAPETGHTGQTAEIPAAPAETAAPETRLTQQGSETPAEHQPQTGGILLNFHDAPLDTILTYLSEVAGLSVLREAPVTGRVTLMNRQPLSIEEAVSLLNVALKEKGYAAITMGRTLKIVPLADAKKRNIPVRSGNDPALIEPNDRVITQIIPVRYLDAVKLKENLVPLIPAYAELSSNASSNALILTDTGANIRRIVEIVHALDTTMSAVSEVRVFKLKYANATNTAKLINDLFKIDPSSSSSTQRQSERPGRFTMNFPPGTQTTAGTTATENNQRQVKTLASADDRTGTVVISGPPDVLKMVEGVVRELDSNPDAEQDVFIYHLKNASAKTMETTLNNLFGTSSSTRTGSSTTSQNPFTAFNRQGNTTTASSTGTSGSLVGQVYVVANTDTNSLMVMTASKNFDRVREVISDLDRSVPQVLIKVLIAEVTLDKSIDLGAEFSVLNLTTDGRGTSAISDFGVSAMTTGLTINAISRDVTATLAALQKVGKLEILSRPYILGSDNQAASITVGQEVPFITSSRTTDTGQTINTIQYQDIGIILKVTPHINPDGLVTLDVSPEISTLTGTTVPISETVDAPVFAKRSATSRVAIRDGQTIVIGGLMQDNKTEDIKKIPLLGDIPLIGTLFRRNTTENTKTELLIFLTPHVAIQPDALMKISAGEVEGSRVIPNAIAPGAFEEHLKGMERKSPTNPESAK